MYRRETSYTNVCSYIILTILQKSVVFAVISVLTKVIWEIRSCSLVISY